MLLRTPIALHWLVEHDTHDNEVYEGDGRENEWERASACRQ